MGMNRQPYEPTEKEVWEQAARLRAERKPKKPAAKRRGILVRLTAEELDELKAASIQAGHSTLQDFTLNTLMQAAKHGGFDRTPGADSKTGENRNSPD